MVHTTGLLIGVNTFRGVRTTEGGCTTHLWGGVYTLVYTLAWWKFGGERKGGVDTTT